MDIQLKFINQSADGNNSEIVLFQKNVSADMEELAVAWKVIRYCGRDCWHPFVYPMGFEVASSDNYGNYQYSDGSVMVWVPRFYYRIGSPASPRYATHGANAIDIVGDSVFKSEADANSAGYALHRAFFDGGPQLGFFVDKYQCSNNGGIASSIRYGAPLSTAAAHNPISVLNGAPANTYAGAIAAVIQFAGIAPGVIEQLFAMGAELLLSPMLFEQRVPDLVLQPLHLLGNG